MRPTLTEALARMRGEEIGALLRSDGSARLQWPHEDGSLPPEMRRFMVEDARLEGELIAMDLTSPEVSLTFRFAIDGVML